jgi:hypothetical protein
VLFGRTQPLIRYELSDTIIPSDRLRCLCGRPFALIEGIQGRVEEALSLPARSGGQVTAQPAVVCGVMDGGPAEGWQLVQEPGRLAVLLAGVPDAFDQDSPSCLGGYCRLCSNSTCATREWEGPDGMSAASQVHGPHSSPGPAALWPCRSVWCGAIVSFLFPGRDAAGGAFPGRCQIPGPSGSAPHLVLLPVFCAWDHRLLRANGPVLVGTIGPSSAGWEC